MRTSIESSRAYKVTRELLSVSRLTRGWPGLQARQTAGDSHFWFSLRFQKRGERCGRQYSSYESRDTLLWTRFGFDIWAWEANRFGRQPPGIRTAPISYGAF
jgi:hypothetical protein